MSDSKLVYFGIRGRAEPMRMTFAAAGKKFEDVRIPMDQWPAEKPKTPYGTLPYLVYKGKTYGQSAAIASFVARECGLAGKGAVDELRCNEAYILAGELLEAVTKPMFESDDAKKAELMKAAEAKVPVTLGYFEKMLKDAGKGYMIGSALTQADLTVYDITCTVLKQNPKALDSFPLIQKMRKNVEGNSKVKAYLAAQPDSPM